MKNKDKIAIIITIISIIYSILPVIDCVHIFDNKNESYFADAITKDTTIEQRFIPKSNANGVGIIIGTYMKTLVNGVLDVSIYEENSKKMIYNKKISFSNITDSDVLDFKCKIRKNKKYVLKIQIKDINENNMIAFKVHKTQKNNLIINNKEQKYSMNLGFIKYNKSFSNIWVLAVIAIIDIMYFKYVKGCEKNEK